MILNQVNRLVFLANYLKLSWAIQLTVSSITVTLLNFQKFKSLFSICGISRHIAYNFRFVSSMK